MTLRIRKGAGMQRGIAVASKKIYINSHSFNGMAVCFLLHFCRQLCAGGCCFAAVGNYIPEVARFKSAGGNYTIAGSDFTKASGNYTVAGGMFFIAGATFESAVCSCIAAVANCVNDGSYFFLGTNCFNLKAFYLGVLGTCSAEY